MIWFQSISISMHLTFFEFSVYIFKLDAVKKTKNIENNVNELSGSLGKRSFLTLLRTTKDLMGRTPLRGFRLARPSFNYLTTRIPTLYTKYN